MSYYELLPQEEDSVKKATFYPRTLLVLIACLSILSCHPERGIEQALSQVEEYKSPGMMWIAEEEPRMSRIKDTLKTPEGIDALAQAYKGSDDLGYKERLLCLCFSLTYVAGPEARDSLIVFLTSVVTTETNGDLRYWAATGLTRLAGPGMEDTFGDWFNSEDEIMWKHAAGGLWQIGSERSVNSLIAAVRQRQANQEFTSFVREMVSSDSNQFTSKVIEEISK
jgi:hypothetical protein